MGRVKDGLQLSRGRQDQDAADNCRDKGLYKLSKSQTSSERQDVCSEILVVGELVCDVVSHLLLTAPGTREDEAPPSPRHPIKLHPFQCLTNTTFNSILDRLYTIR